VPRGYGSRIGKEGMSTREPDFSQDLYEILQISPSAEPETIHRVFRMLAQRYHPDNQETGDEARFQVVKNAYLVLSEPEKRAQYDVHYEEVRRNHWRAKSAETPTENEFELEEITRLMVLELLYNHRRADMQSSGIFILDFEDLTRRPREHLEFTMWYLLRKGYVEVGDNSRYSITAEGVDYLEAQQKEGLLQRRLKPGDEPAE